MTTCFAIVANILLQISYLFITASSFMTCLSRFRGSQNFEVKGLAVTNTDTNIVSLHKCFLPSTFMTTLAFHALVGIKRAKHLMLLALLL